MTTINGGHDTAGSSAINYAAFSLGIENRPRIGHLDLEQKTISPLSYKSGAAVSTLYEVIECGNDSFATTDEIIPLSSVKLLAPISGRDILAVGKNYVDHAKEFNASGYDASDKNDQPSHPVIFTKRYTSIVAHNDEILPHQGFTESVDYEGEIGVIIGKTGFRISETEAADYIWGYTIINDMTARERQRDHKQFFLGKSPDTYCPIGPIAVAKEHLPKTLTVQTFVNGDKRQEANTDQLIFGIPQLIETISAGQTIQAGDVIATGTPAGVGFGFRPFKFLNPGDEISISVTGLGTLTNRIAEFGTENKTTTAITAAASCVPIINRKALDVPQSSNLVSLGSKRLFFRRLGNQNGPKIVFIHGLGGTHDYFVPMVAVLQEKYDLYLTDLEGHGLSPSSVSSTVSITSYAKDIAELLAANRIDKTIVVAHSMGCLVATQLCLENPSLVSTMVLMGPPPCPLPEAAVQGTLARAKLVRLNGMLEVADTLATSAVSKATQAKNRVAVAAVRMSIVSQHPEGYAKACVALASAPALDMSKIPCPVLLLTGADDKVSPPLLVESYRSQIKDAKVSILPDTGHWHVFEKDLEVTKLVTDFLG